MRRNGKLVVAIAVHLLASVVSVAVAFGETMRIFDDPLGEMSLPGRFAAAAASVLLFPAGRLRTPWASQTLGDGIEWLLFGLNSVLWGYALERPGVGFLSPAEAGSTLRGVAFLSPG